MPDLTAFSRRLRRLKTAAAALFFAGAGMLVIDFTTKFPTAQKGEFAALWLVAIAVSGYLYYRSMELPATEVLQLAEAKGGLLTLSEIATALNIDPALALRTLQYLQSTGVAAPHWQELQKNLWQFPDYLKLPLAQSLDFAKANGGRVSLKDLLAQGHSVDTAMQTFQTLTDKGLAQADPASPTPSVIIATQ
jgi:hypothetical protein